jgi:Flp pilus assembly pilin Flp
LRHFVLVYSEEDRPEPGDQTVAYFFSRALRSLCFDEEGQTLVEYALILVLVSIAAVGLLASIGAYPSSVFSHLNADF